MIQSELMVKICTYDNNTEIVDDERVINYADQYVRKWLAGHMWWALTHNKAIEFTPAPTKEEK